MSRRTLTLLLSTLLATCLVVGALVAQVPYVALGPGPTFDTLGDEKGKPVINIVGRATYPTNGRLDLTTVGVQSSLTLGEALQGWFRRDEAVVPRDLVFPPGQTDEQVDAENTRAMSASQDAATTAALAALDIPVAVEVAGVADGAPAQGRLQPDDVLTSVDGTPVTDPVQLRTLIGDRAVGDAVRIGYRRGSTAGTAELTTASSGETPPRPVIGVETDVAYPFTVDIALEEVGGPSAGLMFALGIIDKLGPDSLTGGRYVAGTGEISPDGVVGPIGGIQQKVVAAREKGAELFLVPAANCPDAVANAPAGLRLARIGTLDDALAALEAVRGGGEPVLCTA